MRLNPAAIAKTKLGALAASWMLAPALMLALMAGPGAADPGRDFARFPAAGRPMEDLGDAPRYGTLRDFDAIRQIGADQPANVPYCDRRGVMLATLDHDFGETSRLRRGIDPHRSVELWASDVMGTWTAVYNRADGVSCVISSGMGWSAGDNPVRLLRVQGILPTS